MGSGALMKPINNMVCGVQVASLAEAAALIDKSGLDLTGGVPGSPLVGAIASRITNQDYNVHFAVHLMEKDLTYALAEGSGHGAGLATVEAAAGVFRRANEAGWGEKAIASVVEPIRAVGPAG
jgi:3-hydroxyisobutyrate dehydrogenase